MGTLLTKLAGRERSEKGFVQPPFWANPYALWRDLVGDKEQISSDFGSYISDAYKANGVVFACILARLLVFSEARFVWRQLQNGRPSRLFSNADLALLENPWPGATTGELLARMEQDASLAGNSFTTVVGAGGARRLRRLRPEWVTIVAASENEDPYALDATVVGYAYCPGGHADRMEVLTPAEVAHYSPIPDPDAQYRGMSWLTPVLREIESDKATTKHKLNFFRNGAVPQVIVTYDKAVAPAAFERFVELFKEKHQGVDNHYKTLHLAGGADAKVVGSNLQQLDLKVSQGTLETRIAAAAGVHPIIVGLSEGLQGSSLNEGNFEAAKRRFADGTIRPLWRIAAASLATLITSPGSGAQLWYDDRDVPFLREDASAASSILQSEAQTIAALVREGFDADTVIDAVVSGDLRRLAGSHSGLYSVQLQPAGADMSMNGDGAKDVQLAHLKERLELLESREPIVVNMPNGRPKRLALCRDETGMLVGLEEVADESR